MTPSPQSPGTSSGVKEYRITDGRLIALQAKYGFHNQILAEIRSRVVEKPKLLNTQPEGTTCENCQRFRNQDCPYPGSNITMITCNAFLMDLKQHDAAIRKEAYEQGAREERENCIIELLSYLSDYMPKTTRGAQYKHRAKKMIESLRNNEVGK